MILRFGKREGISDLDNKHSGEVMNRNWKGMGGREVETVPTGNASVKSGGMCLSGESFFFFPSNGSNI